MKTIETRPIQLATNDFEAFRIHDKRRLLCIDGELWVTQEGVQRDFILQAGDSLEIGCEASIGVSALKPSRFELSEVLSGDCKQVIAPRYQPGASWGLRSAA